MKLFGKMMNHVKLVRILPFRGIHKNSTKTLKRIATKLNQKSFYLKNLRIKTFGYYNQADHRKSGIGENFI